MELKQIVIEELDRLEEHLAKTLTIEQMQSPLGYGITMLLSTARQDPVGFYQQAKQIRNLLGSIIDGIEANANVIKGSLDE
jgi:hypothetical protein